MKQQHWATMTSRLGAVSVGLLVAIAVSCSEDEKDKAGETSSGGMGGTTLIDPDAGATGGTAGAPSGTGGTTPVTLPPCPSLAEKVNTCGKSNQSADYRSPNVLLVLDKSGSMGKLKTGDLFNWEAMRQALDTALTKAGSGVSFGLILYPAVTIVGDCTGTGATCYAMPPGADAVSVPITSGESSVGKILGALDATGPGGGTPTAEALARALEYYTQGAGKDLPGEKYVLLATDGGPNGNSTLTCDASRCTQTYDNPTSCGTGLNCCSKVKEGCVDDAAVTQKIEALKAAGIKTFVVGIPGSDPYKNYLNDFAIAGGKATALPPPEPQYYAVTAESGVQGLVDVFDTISTQLIKSCDIKLEEEPSVLDDILVAVECELIPQETAGVPAWEVDVTTKPGVIHLLGETCDRVKNNGVERIDVVLGCPGVF